MTQSDGFGEAVDEHLRMGLLLAAKVAEQIIQRRAARRRDSAERTATAAAAQERVLAAQRDAVLRPLAQVHDDRWWDANPRPDRVVDAYAKAKTWEHEDLRAAVLVERIEAEMKTRYGIDISTDLESYRQAEADAKIERSRAAIREEGEAHDAQQWATSDQVHPEYRQYVEQHLERGKGTVTRGHITDAERDVLNDMTAAQEHGRLPLDRQVHVRAALSDPEGYYVDAGNGRPGRESNEWLSQQWAENGMSPDRATVLEQLHNKPSADTALDDRTPAQSPIESVPAAAFESLETREGDQFMTMSRAWLTHASHEDLATAYAATVGSEEPDVYAVAETLRHQMEDRGFTGVPESVTNRGRIRELALGQMTEHDGQATAVEASTVRTPTSVAEASYARLGRAITPEEAGNLDDPTRARAEHDVAFQHGTAGEVARRYAEVATDPDSGTLNAEGTYLHALRERFGVDSVVWAADHGYDVDAIEAEVNRRIRIAARDGATSAAAAAADPSLARDAREEVEQARQAEALQRREQRADVEAAHTILSETDRESGRDDSAQVAAAATMFSEADRRAALGQHYRDQGFDAETVEARLTMDDVSPRHPHEAISDQPAISGRRGRALDRGRHPKARKGGRVTNRPGPQRGRDGR